MAPTQSSFSFPIGARQSVVLVALLLGGCPPPGKGAKAEAGYRRAAPVIVALDRYRQEHGTYPETLAELPPEWLPPAQDAQPAGLKYDRLGDHYRLSFSYGGPGVNHCSYDSSSGDPKHWRCGGYY